MVVRAMCKGGIRIFRLILKGFQKNQTGILLRSNVSSSNRKKTIIAQGASVSDQDDKLFHNLTKKSALFCSDAH